MLITPIISGGIPEIPISGNNEYKVSIPFKHHPSIASEKTIYVRFIDLGGNTYTPSTSTINDTQFIECTISSFSQNTILKFQLSYDKKDWSPAVATKCIANPADYLTMTQTGLGFRCNYNTNVGTKLSQLTFETTTKEKQKLHIQTIVQNEQEIQTAFCTLNSILPSYTLTGVTIGGYKFSKNFSFNWNISSGLIRAKSISEGICIYNNNTNGILCHKANDQTYWKPLTKQTPPYIYIDNNIEAEKQYVYQVFTISANKTDQTIDTPAAISLMSDMEYVAFNDEADDTDKLPSALAPLQELMYLQGIKTGENDEETSIKTLYIAFNPQISSFKRVIQEQKIETIGNQYPIFVRNGHINYHEFSIGGLISYLMDPVLTEDGVSRTGFYTEAEWGKISNKEQSTTNLTPENIQREVQFRNDVINWLMDGKDKEFYSPTEGRMKVRLTNVQLTPETKLGRMIYSFTAQATEVGEIE